MPAPYSATTIANRFIELAEANSGILTPMKIIKLSYIAHGWSLSLLGHGLISEGIEAWQYGPVVPDLYHRLKEFGKGPVSGRLAHTIFDRNTEIEPEDDSIITQVYEKYGHLSGVQLSHLTHRVGTPWHSTYRSGVYGVHIPDDVIRSHYDTIRATH